MTAGYLEDRYDSPEYVNLGDISLGDTLVLKALNNGEVTKIFIDRYVESRLKGMVGLDNMKSTTYYALLRLVDRGYVVKIGTVPMVMRGKAGSERHERKTLYDLTESGYKRLMLCEQVLNTILEDE